MIYSQQLIKCINKERYKETKKKKKNVFKGLLDVPTFISKLYYLSRHHVDNRNINRNINRPLPPQIKQKLIT